MDKKAEQASRQLLEKWNPSYMEFKNGVFYFEVVGRSFGDPSDIQTWTLKQTSRNTLGTFLGEILAKTFNF